MKKLVMISLASVAAMMLYAKPADAIVREDNTDVGVSFKSNDDTIPGKGPYKDNLALVWKPNAFQFGEQTAVAGTSTYNGVATKEPQYLVVNEDRPTDKISTWDLKATMSELQVKGVQAEGVSASLEFKMNELTEYNIGSKLNEENDYDAPNPSKNPDQENGTDVPGTGRLSLGGAVDSDATGVNLGGTLADDKKSSTVKLEGNGQTSVVVMSKYKADYKEKGGYATEITDKKLTIVTSNASNLAGKKMSGVVTWTLNDTVEQ